MPIIEIKIPSLGEGVTDVTLTKWLAKEGDKLNADDVIAEIATDKVDTEIFSPCDGTLKLIKQEEGAVVDVGTCIAHFESNSAIDEAIPQTEESTHSETTKEIFRQKDYQKPSVNTITIHKHRFIPPFIRQLSSDYGVSIEELYQLTGTGTDGELTKEDIKQYVYTKRINIQDNLPSQLNKGKQINGGKTYLIENNQPENSEIIEMDRMRKLIADHMVRSKSISPHVTSFIEADVTNLVNWRNSIKERFIKETGQKLTFTPIFVETVVKALKQFPMVNASVDNNNIYLKKNINVGIATALTNGNLIVPVIKDADKKNLTGLAKEVNDIVVRARQNKLTPSEVKGGTFTITNLGNFESLAGTPIINQPEVAILAIGAITRKPAVVKINGAETIGIRDIVMLSLAYDHRIIDGYLGGMFLKFIKDTLQNFEANRKLFT